MAFFDQDDDVYVSSTTISLVQADGATIGDTVLYAILADESIAMNLLNQTLNGLATKIPSFQSYADEYYALGLPDMSLGASPVLDESILKDIIIEELGLTTDIVIESSVIAPLTIGFVVYPFLLATRGLQPGNYIKYLPDGTEIKDFEPDVNTTNIRVNLSGLHLEDDNQTITITYTVQEWMYNPPTQLDYDQGIPGIYTEGTSYEITEEYEMAEAYDIGRIYCIVSYSIYTGEEEEEETISDLNWWFYDLASGTHSEINDAQIESEGQNLLPVVPLRYNNDSVRDETSEYYDVDVYETGKSLLNKINVDMDAILDSLETSTSIDDIDFAYIMFGVNLQTEDNVAIAYLTEFFDYIQENAVVNIWDSITTLLEGTQTLSSVVYFTDNGAVVPGTIITETITVPTGRDTEETITVEVIKNTTPPGFDLSEFGLRMYITYSSISSYTVFGSIPDTDGSVGSATITRTVPDAIDSVYAGTPWDALDESTYTFRSQVNTAYYKEVVITGLNHYNQVYQDHTVRTTGSQLMTDPDNNNFIVPLHSEIAKRLSSASRDTLYGNSCQLILNSYTIVEYAWYETSFFQFLVYIVIMIVVAWTGQVWLTNIAATAEGGTVAIMMYLLKNIVISMALSAITKEIAKVIGPEAAAIVAVLVAVVSIVFGGSGWNIDFGFTTMPLASTLLSISTALIDAVQTVIGYAIDDITAQYNQFLVDFEEKEELLTTAQEYLAQFEPTFLTENLLYIQDDSNKKIINPIRDPETYYNLLIHTGNIGTLTLKMPSMYVQIATTLPDADRSLYGWA